MKVGRLYLAGGGDEKQSFKVDEQFLKDIKNILYVPLAWKNDNFGPCLEWFQNLVSLHKKAEIDMLTDANKEIDLSNFDAVYIGGGNTFKLLKRLKESKLYDKLLKFYKNGGTVYGGSAGAIIWGKDISTSNDKNEVQLQNLEGFNQVRGFNVACHYLDSQLKDLQQEVKKNGIGVIAIPEKSAIFIEKDKIKVMGKERITIVTPEETKTYKPDTEIKK